MWTGRGLSNHSPVLVACVFYDRGCRISFSAVMLLENQCIGESQRPGMSRVHIFVSTSRRLAVAVHGSRMTWRRPAAAHGSTKNQSFQLARANLPPRKDTGSRRRCLPQRAADF